MEMSDKRVQRSKADIKATFLSLLHKKPFSKITIMEIANQANYNRGTFYANFATKEILLQEIADDTLRELLTQIRYPYKDHQEVSLLTMNPQHITVFDYIKQHADLYKLLLNDQTPLNFGYQMAKAIENLFIAEYEYVLDDSSHIDLKWLYVYRAHGVAGLMIRWIEEDFRCSAEHMAEQIIKLMLLSTERFRVSP